MTDKIVADLADSANELAWVADAEVNLFDLDDRCDGEAGDLCGANICEQSGCVLAKIARAKARVAAAGVEWKD